MKKINCFLLTFFCFYWNHAIANGDNEDDNSSDQTVVTSNTSKSKQVHFLLLKRCIDTGLDRTALRWLRKISRNYGLGTLEDTLEFFKYELSDQEKKYLSRLLQEYVYSKPREIDLVRLRENHDFHDQRTLQIDSDSTSYCILKQNSFA